MKAAPNAAPDRETTFVTQLAAGISLLSFLIFFSRGYLLLYGDAVAHINIARRVFDSRTPGLLQLGTVWLPLPHLAMIPFLLSRKLWQTGTGGSIPSMVAYVLSVAGIFRMVRDALSSSSEKGFLSRFTPWLAVGIYALNPNLIYLQTTAMTEPIYLAFFIWALVFFMDFARQIRNESSEQQMLIPALTKSGWCIFGACLTRYDGWWLACVMCAAAICAWQAARSERFRRRKGLLKFILLAIAGPMLWLAYNAAVYRNPLEFANGPYSARAIEQKATAPGTSPHPGAREPGVAFSFFIKSAELNMASPAIVQRLWVFLLVAGTITALAFDLTLWPLLMLWLPLPFYIFSISYGGVPIFLPVWWPYSYYNVRYGIELLPAFAVFMSLGLHFWLRRIGNRTLRLATIGCALVLVLGSYIFAWREQPICLREAVVNSRDRIPFERMLAATLRKLPPDSTLLMYLGDHVGALQLAGFPLDRVINEGNHRSWKKPSDANGLWERALQNPQQYADYVIAIEGDPVSRQLNQGNLSPLVVIHSSGEPAVNIYWTHRSK